MSGPFLLATRSSGKLRELKPLFADAGVEIIDLNDANIAASPDEDGIEVFETFEENALAKARYFFAKSGKPTVADDSGLEVAALGGAPGVLSKRFSGRTDLTGHALDEANNAALLAALRDVADRRARYVCVAAFVDGSRECAFRGTTEGRIIDTPRGPNGFGYDAFFASDELGVTFGEATREAKEVISHRGRAFRALISALRGR